MNKIIQTLLISCVFVSPSYGGTDDDQFHEMIENKSGKIVQMKATQGESSTQVTRSISVVRLEEGRDESPIVVQSTPTFIQQVKDIGIMFASVTGGTLFGTLIGTAIMGGEYGAETTKAVIKLGTPVIIGGMMGYTGGWVAGQITKCKLNRNQSRQ